LGNHSKKHRQLFSPTINLTWFKAYLRVCPGFLTIQSVNHSRSTSCLTPLTTTLSLTQTSCLLFCPKGQPSLGSVASLLPSSVSVHKSNFDVQVEPENRSWTLPLRYLGTLEFERRSYASVNRNVPLPPSLKLRRTSARLPPFQDF